MMIKRWPTHIPHLPHRKITIYGWSTSEVPPLTAEICGSAGASLQVSAL